jgi:hypothetical protein
VREAVLSSLDEGLFKDFQKSEKFTPLLYSGEHALTIFFIKKHLLSFSSAENSEVFLSHRISRNI